MVKGYTHVDDTERRLVKNMKQEGLTWAKIESITGRSSSTLERILAPQKSKAPKNPKGAPRKLRSPKGAP